MALTNSKKQHRHTLDITKGWDLNTVYSIACAGHSIAFLHLVTLWFDLWPSELILIGGQGLAMDYPCAKFGDFSFSRFGFIAQTNRQTRAQNDKHTPLNTLLPWLSSTWVMRPDASQLLLLLLLLLPSITQWVSSRRWRLALVHRWHYAARLCRQHVSPTTVTRHCHLQTLSPTYNWDETGNKSPTLRRLNCWAADTNRQLQYQNYSTSVHKQPDVWDP